MDRVTVRDGAIGRVRVRFKVIIMVWVESSGLGLGLEFRLFVKAKR